MNPQAHGLPDPASSGRLGLAPEGAIGAPRETLHSGPPEESSELALFQSIGEHLERAESFLLRPSADNAARLVAELEQCCQLMASAWPLWQSSTPPTPALPHLLPWRRSLERLELLTAGASAFCQGWAAAAGLASGYTATGANPLLTSAGPRLDQTG